MSITGHYLRSQKCGMPVIKGIYGHLPTGHIHCSHDSNNCFPIAPAGEVSVSLGLRVPRLPRAGGQEPSSDTAHLL